MGKAEAVRLGVSAANALMRAAFSPPCAACGAPLREPLAGCVCTACWMAVEPAPYVEWPARIRIAAAAGSYDGSLRQIIHAFKYDGRRSLASPLGTLLRQHGDGLLSDASCIVPVPLHPWRRIRRGFNQASDLASALGLPVRPVLWRARPTQPQAALDAARRMRNVCGAFGVSPLASRRLREALRNQVVVLVDDVRTTGATLDECADVLLALGVCEVRALTVAVAPLERDSRINAKG